MLTEPGFWEIDEAQYHADPAPEPSLSNSIGKILLEKCPRAAWWAHPRLNPRFTPVEEARMERGTVAHAMLLGKGRPIKIIDAPDYRTKEARLQRDAFREAGFTPILLEHHTTASAMVDAARKQLHDVDGGAYAFSAEYGDMELCGLIRDPVGCWSRTLIDFYGHAVPDGVTCWDYKTTSGSANPAQLRSHFNRMGWAFQAAFQERIIILLRPELAGRLRFRFLVQEVDEPYMCSVVEPASDARVIAHKQVAAALAIWMQCLRNGVWPGYPRAAIALGVLPGAEAAWLSRELDDELVQLAAHDPFLAQAFQEPYERVDEYPAGRREGVTLSPRAPLLGHEFGDDAFRLQWSDARQEREHGGKSFGPPPAKRGPYRPAKPGDRRRKENRPPPPGLTIVDGG